MTPNRLTAIAFRWSSSAVFTLYVFAPNAQAQNAATAIDGVYNGTYTCAIGPRTLKLSLLASGNGSLTGLFTFYLPPTSHTQAFSYSLNGTFDPASGQFKLDPVKWEVPPPVGYAMVGMKGAFDPGTGQVAGKITYGGCSTFQATRDQAESANIAKAVAPQGATGIAQQHPSTATTTATRGSAPGSSAAVIQNPATSAEGRTPRVPLPPTSLAAPRSEATAASPSTSTAKGIVHEPAATTAEPKNSSITGVYNGTYICTRVQLNLKLALIAAPDGSLTGFFMVEWPGNIPGYPPPDSGSRFTYKLNGRYRLPPSTPAGRIVGRADYVLTATPWGTPAPADCSMGQVRGQYYVDSDRNIGADMISGFIDNRSRSEFHLIRDKNASPTAVALAAESEPPTSSQASPASLQSAAAKARATADRDAAIKTAAPAQLASPDVVRKSKAYWDTYQTDFIRQVFDGGFGSDVDVGTQFRMLFTGYVEMFSKSCAASLPARHETVTVTEVTTKRDRYGNVVGKEQGQSYTIEVDSRFAPYYRKYHESLTSSGAGLAGALGIMSGRVSASAYFAPGTDMIKFFEKETCKSAAMRQLGENLVRGANGSPSVQQAGATIAGAAAETDRSLPPGRYARFVDGCHGFFRDPANARFRGLHSSAYCDCLGVKYQRLMTRDEEYYYANDFGKRFRSQIAQPGSTDPASPRLHPAVDDCVDETSK